MTPSPSTVFRSVEAVTEVNPRKGLVRAIISDDSTDRYKTVFDPRGCDWDGFMRAGGPVVYEHGRMASRLNLPVGNVAEIERGTYKGKGAIIASTRFADDDELSRAVGEAYRSMKMRGWSVHALPRVQSPPTAAEKRARSDWAGATTVYREWELLDLSVCTTPGNSNTLTTEVLRSLGALAGARNMAGTSGQTQGLKAEFVRLSAAAQMHVVAVAKHSPSSIPGLIRALLAQGHGARH
jgi:hypothetical protein